jgi:hypothetical protein
MDGVDNRDFLPASTSSKPAKAANGEITPHEEQDKKDEPLPIRRKSLVHVPDMSLDDLELDDEDNGQDPDREPQRSSKESPLRKGPQDSIPTLNNANVAEESNEPGKPNSAFECMAAHHKISPQRVILLFPCHGVHLVGSRQLPDLFLPSRAWNAPVSSL